MAHTSWRMAHTSWHVTYMGTRGAHTGGHAAAQPLTRTINQPRSQRFLPFYSFTFLPFPSAFYLFTFLLFYFSDCFFTFQSGHQKSRHFLYRGSGGLGSYTGCSAITPGHRWQRHCRDARCGGADGVRGHGGRPRGADGAHAPHSPRASRAVRGATACTCQSWGLSP